MQTSNPGMFMDPRQRFGAPQAGPQAPQAAPMPQAGGVAVSPSMQATAGPTQPRMMPPNSSGAVMAPGMQPLPPPAPPQALQPTNTGNTSPEEMDRERAFLAALQKGGGFQPTPGQPPTTRPVPMGAPPGASPLAAVARPVPAGVNAYQPRSLLPGGNPPAVGAPAIGGSRPPFAGGY